MKMRAKSSSPKTPAEKVVKDIRRATRKHYSAEDKIRIVLEGLRGEASIAELCRKEGIAQSMYYGWSKEFLEAGKRRLAGDTARDATSDEVKTLRVEARQLKEALAEATLENRLLKKSVIAVGRTGHEISRVRKARDHRDRRDIAAAGAAYADASGHPKVDVLQLARSLCGGW